MLWKYVEYQRNSIYFANISATKDWIYTKFKTKPHKEVVENQTKYNGDLRTYIEKMRVHATKHVPACFGLIHMCALIVLHKDFLEVQYYFISWCIFTIFIKAQCFLDVFWNLYKTHNIKGNICPTNVIYRRIFFNQIMTLKNFARFKRGIKSNVYKERPCRWAK